MSLNESQACQELGPFGEPPVLRRFLVNRGPLLFDVQVAVPCYLE